MHCHREWHRLPWLFLSIILCLSKTIQSAKILGIFPHSSESNFVVMRTFMMELARREHNVTIYNSHRLDERLDNLEEHIVEPEFPFWKEVREKAAVKSLQELSKLNDGKLENALASAGAALMDNFLSNQHMKKLLNTPIDDFDYDLIIVDLFYTEAILALGYHFNTPIVGVVSSDFDNYMQKVQEIMVPSACLPYKLEQYEADLGYWQRLKNIQLCIKRRSHFINDHYANQEKIIQKHFIKNRASVPNVVQLQSNMALLLLNDYYPLAKPKPLIPSIIQVGGFHIRPPRELPWHIRRFLDEARSGVIYMHLGDAQLCGEIPQDKLDIIMHVFSTREERVLWTCHDVQKIEGQPKNMMLQHMVPQTDILAHPHVKVFIMNGDLMGLQESIVRHVPILGIPLFSNEVSNMLVAENLQLGLRLDYANLTEVSLKWALDTIIRQNFHMLNTRDISKIFRDRPLGGLASAFFWLDYILQYGSLPLKTPGVGMDLSELHLFDLMLYRFLMAIVIVMTLIAAYFIGKFLLKRREAQKMFSKLN